MTAASCNHEEAVLEAIHVVHKRVSLTGGGSSGMGMSCSNNGMNGSTRSCLKDSSSRRSARESARRVSFCEKGHQCEEFQMYSDEDVEEVWFSGQDYDDMKKAFEFTVFMMDAGCPEKVEDEEHTTRGLEKRSEEGQWKRYERKRDYYNAVLDEQERQWEEDMDDHDKISEIAVQVTRDSFREAQDQGVLDEIAVYGHALRRGGRTVSKRSISEGTAETQDENDSWPSEAEQD